MTDTSEESGPPGPGVSAPPAEEPEEEGKKRRSFFTELPVLVVIAFVLALVLKTFLIQAFFIPSSSMEPTLQVSDRVLVNKLAYTLREPRRGEVAVFTDHEAGAEADTGLMDRITDAVSAGLGLPRSGERDFIKRIIGLPGETVSMHDGTVFIDDEPLPESPVSNGGYLSADDLSDFGPVTVPDDEYFVMGDNRPRSADSRAGLGTIPREDLIGRAFVVIWPPSHVDTLPIADYDGVGDDGGSDSASQSESAPGTPAPSSSPGKEVARERRGGPRTLRGRDGARSLSGVPGRGGHVPLPGRDRAAFLPRQ